MNIVKLRILLFILAICHNAFAQKQNNQWRFGNAGAIDFNTLPPSFVNDCVIATPEGSASVADRLTGALLFYTDGVSVWNANNQIMPNGTGLLGGVTLSSTTAAVIVPKPGSSNLYYIVTVDEFTSNNGVRYSVVDMTLNGGLGDIVAGQKNIFLFQTFEERLEVVPASDGQSYWLLTHNNSNSSFYSFRINNAGIQNTPVVSTVGSANQIYQGHIKINKQFNKIAMGISDDSDIELFDFNNATGVLSNPKALNFNLLSVAYGIEFSPDGKVLYFSDGYSIFQLDLTQTTPQAIQNSAYQVSTTQGGVLQLGIDGKIYVTSSDLTIDAINCPNKLGAACGFTTSVISTGPTWGGGSALPKWVYYLNDTALLTSNSIAYSDSCFGNATQFSIQNTAGFSSITWNFNDPSSGVNNTSTSLTPTHIFSATGTYNVTANGIAPCGSFQINYPLQIVNCATNCTGTIISYDTCQLRGTSFQVVSNNTINSIVWNFDDPSSGANNTSTSLTPTHLFSTAGTYNISSIVNFACGADTIYKTISIINCDSIVGPCQFFIPTAFTPNGDGVNDNFRPKANCKTEKYELLIYNRWGQVVFNTRNQYNFWDGKLMSKDASAGSYIYMLKYKFPSQDFKKANGSILLIR